jgi:hypothetical protein
MMTYVKEGDWITLGGETEEVFPPSIAVPGCLFAAGASPSSVDTAAESPGLS